MPVSSDLASSRRERAEEQPCGAIDEPEDGHSQAHHNGPDGPLRDQACTTVPQLNNVYMTLMMVTPMALPDEGVSCSPLMARATLERRL